MSEKDLAQLIEDMSNSLHTELHQVVDELRTEWRESADRIENAVGRNSKMVTAGTLAVER